MAEKIPTAEKFIAFAIDAGSVSGWAIALHAEGVLASGVAKKAHERAAVVERVWRLTQTKGYPLVIVTESFNAGGWRSHKALIGVGKALGRWLDHIELALDVKETHILKANVSKWRHHFFDHKLLKDAVKVENGLKKLACSFAGVEDHNRAEAICLALFAQSSIEGVEAAEAALRRLKHRLRSGGSRSQRFRVASKA